MMTHTSQCEKIADILRTNLNPKSLSVTDFTEQHRHHKQAPQGQGHYHIHISAECFETQQRLEQHKVIYKLLQPLLNRSIHALKITVTDHPHSVD